MNINHTKESVTAHDPRYKPYLPSILPYINIFFPIMSLFPPITLAC